MEFAATEKRMPLPTAAGLAQQCRLAAPIRATPNVTKANL
jgi:hypothetical protein